MLQAAGFDYQGRLLGTGAGKVWMWTKRGNSVRRELRQSLFTGFQTLDHLYQRDVTKDLEPSKKLRTSQKTGGNKANRIERVPFSDSENIWGLRPRKPGQSMLPGMKRLVKYLVHKDSKLWRCWRKEEKVKRELLSFYEFRNG